MANETFQTDTWAPAATPGAAPVVGIIMGSRSDWSVLEAAAETLKIFEVPFETAVVSAHRTPDRLTAYAGQAQGRGLNVIIAGAGGAAHLPGMVASMTLVPVLGVPVPTKAMDGLDSLLSIVQMPAGIPVGTLAVGEAGARNAALMAVAILALNDAGLAEKWRVWREHLTAQVPFVPDDHADEDGCSCGAGCGCCGSDKR